jgi:hypothetical protein
MRYDLLAIAILALVVRGYLLFITDAGIESDEAIVGLMAKHIAEGAPWPIFYYGQHYLGSLESLLVSAVFYFFGVSNWGLKAVPLAFAVLHVMLVYLLARQFCDRFGARAAALLTAVPPSTLTIWSTKARGGFIELVVIGSLALLLAVKMLRDSSSDKGPMFVLGLLLGLGWWVNNQIIFYMAAIGLVFLVHYWIQCGLWRTLNLGAIGGAGFVIGGAPFWYANLCCAPRLQSFAVLGQKASLADALSHFQGYILEAIPILFGARRLWTETDLFVGSSALVFVLYGVLFAIAVLRAIWPAKVDFGRFNRSSWCLVVVFSLVVPLVFSLSGFGWLTKAPRYLLPLYSVAYVLIGFALVELRKVPVIGQFVAYAACGILLAINVASNYLGSTAIPGQPFVYKGDRVSRDHQPLYDWLDREGYNHIFTNYWIGYRAAFETKERITFTRYRGPRSLRIPEYEYLSRAENANRVYVLVTAEAREVAQDFRDRGFTYRVTDVAGYQVLDHVRPIVWRGNEVDLSNAVVSATSRTDWAQRIVDGQLGSRWGSGGPQSPGMTLSISLPEAALVSGFDLEMGLWPQDVARYLIVVAEDLQGNRCMLYSGVPDLSKTLKRHRFSLNFMPREIKTLHLHQGGSHGIYDWSVAEVSLYAPGVN